MIMIYITRSVVTVLMGTMLLWTSCSPSRYCAKRFPPSVDTIVTTDTIYKERIIKIELPADTAELLIPIYEIERSGGKPIMRVKVSKKAKVQLYMDSTGVRARATCAEQDSIIKLLEMEIKNNTKVTSVTHIPVKHIPKMYKVAFYWALMSIPVVIFWIIWKIKSLFTIF